MRSSFVVVVWLAACAPMAAPPQQAAFDGWVGDVTQMLAQGGTPGASVAVVVDGRLAFAAGIGKKVYDQDTAVTAATRFRVGSLSKMLVAIAAEQLAAAGKLDLDAPITTYLPWFALAHGFDARAITTRQLLSHTAGLPCDTVPLCPADAASRTAWFAANPLPLWAAPSTTWDYSNPGYSLAALVVTAAAGEPEAAFRQLMTDDVLRPAHMTTATYDPHAAEQADYATGHLIAADGSVVETLPPDSIDCAMLDPPGGVIATASDYGHLAAALLAGSGVLDATSVAQLEAPVIATDFAAGQSYSLGLETEPYPYGPATLVFHNGAVGGYQAQLIMIPAKQFAVVVLINAQGPSVPPLDLIANDALSWFFPDDPQVWPDAAVDPAHLAGYPGVYHDGYGQLGDVAVTATGTTVSIDAPDATDLDGNPTPLTGALHHDAGDAWLLPNGVVATFVANADGVFDRLVTRVGVGIRTGTTAHATAAP
jgi:CubicO group peptidase (beta-lactamase class C family)